MELYRLSKRYMSFINRDTPIFISSLDIRVLFQEKRDRHSVENHLMKMSAEGNTTLLSIFSCVTGLWGYKS